MLRHILGRLQALVSVKRRATDLDEELRFHLDAEADEQEAAGASAADARRHARLDFGNVAVIAEDTRATWGWTWFEQLAQDVRYAARTLTRSRAFTTAAVLSLALGIGANTLLYSFTDGILLRALPVHDPGTLVRMTWHAPKSEFHGSSYHDSSFKDPAMGYADGIFAYTAFELFRGHDDIFSSVIAYQSTGPITLSIHDEAAPATGEYVSGEYFGGLGVVPAAGRLIDAADDRAGAPLIAVLSSAVAHSRFGGPNDAVGQTLLINNTPLTIVGVTPREFTGTDPGAFPDVFVPLHASLALQNEPGHQPIALFNDPNVVWLETMGRLKPGVTLEHAQAALATPYHQFTEHVRTLGTWRQAPELVIVPGAQGIDGMRRAYAAPLMLLTLLSGLILLLACSNIANLLLARSGARAREISVRISLGASRGRVVRQLLTESVVLATLGGLLGVTVAVLGAPVVTRLLADGQANFTLHAELNWRVLSFACALSIVTGLSFGAIPALRATRTAMLPGLAPNNIARSTTGSAFARRAGAKRVLVVLQIGATLVILVAAGLFARTLMNFSAINLGFAPDHLLTVTVNAKQGGMNDAESAQLYRDLRKLFVAMPGALSVGMSDSALVGDERMMTSVVVPGHDPNTGGTLVLNVGPGFFRTQEIPIVSGRDLDERDDRQGAHPVAIVSEAYAHATFGDASAVGQIVRVPVPNGSLQIVGVARDARYYDPLAERPPVVYVPFHLAIFGGLDKMVYEIRTNGDPSTYERTARQIVHDANARVPIVRVATQTSLIDRTIAPQILLSRLCAAFAMLALVVAIVGLYGTVAYDVSRRTAEIGIRMALGAADRQIVRLVLGDVLALTVAGVAVGVPAALAAAKLANVYLYGITSHDPVTIIAAVSILLTASLIASYVPARSASRLNPTVALRRD